MNTNRKELEKLTPEDLEWFNDIIRQAQICKAEANALEQFCMSKLQTNYELQLNYGDKINFNTGEITRAQIPKI